MDSKRVVLRWGYIVFSLLSLLQMVGCEIEEHEERERPEHHEHEIEVR